MPCRGIWRGRGRIEPDACLEPTSSYPAAASAQNSLSGRGRLADIDRYCLSEPIGDRRCSRKRPADVKDGPMANWSVLAVWCDSADIPVPISFGKISSHFAARSRWRPAHRDTAKFAFCALHRSADILPSAIKSENSAALSRPFTSSGRISASPKADASGGSSDAISGKALMGTDRVLQSPYPRAISVVTRFASCLIQRNCNSPAAYGCPCSGRGSGDRRSRQRSRSCGHKGRH